MEKILTAAGLVCKLDESGCIVSIEIDGKEFSGFPGMLKSFDGIRTTPVWSVDGDALKCVMRLERVSGSDSDEAGFRFRIPYAQKQTSMMVWLPREGFPKNTYELGGNAFAYGDVCFGVTLPMAALYIPSSDIGLTVARVPGRTGGRLSFRFDDYHSEGMYLEYTNLEVRSGEPVEITFLLKSHGGCWRPGLQWYADRFRECFEPPNPEVWKCRSFMMTNPFFEDGALDEFVPDWAEVHNHFPYYGDYFPQEKEWKSIIEHDYPADVDGRELICSEDLIRKHLLDLKAKNIKPLIYLQCSGDASIPWAEKHFPEDIARNSVGDMFATWINCCFMNYDKSTEAGKFLRSQFDRMLETYPEIEGIFVDQLCYQTFDFNKSDGRSIKNNCRVYEYGKSIEDNFVEFADKIHAQNKFVLVNGPFDMDVACEADAMMSEGTSSIFESYRYMAIRKPMLIHEFPTDPYNTEMMLRNALVSASGWSFGGTPSCARPMAWSSRVRELYNLYLPLINELFGSKILLTANPLSCKPQLAVKAEIFRSPDENQYFVPILTEKTLHSGELTVTIRIGKEVKSAELKKLGSEEWENISFEKIDDAISIKIKLDSPCFLLKVKSV